MQIKDLLQKPFNTNFLDMIHRLVRLLKASRWITLATLLLYAILQTPRILQNMNRKSGEEILIELDKLFSDSYFTSKNWTCMGKLDIKWPKPHLTDKIFNLSDPFINTTKLDIHLLKRGGIGNHNKCNFKSVNFLPRESNYLKFKGSYDKNFARKLEFLPRIDFKYKGHSTFHELSSNFVSWTENCLEEISTFVPRHIIQCILLTGYKSGYIDQDDSITGFHITYIFQVLNNVSDVNRSIYHDTFIFCFFINKSPKTISSSASIKLSKSKFIWKLHYEDYYFNYLPIRTKIKIPRKCLRKSRPALNVSMGSYRIPISLSNCPNKTEKNIYKRQPNEASDCKSLIGNKPQTCKKARRAFIIFYILLSFAGACCLMLGAVQFWIHRKQNTSKVTSPSRIKDEKIRKNTSSTLHPHKMPSIRIREVKFLKPNSNLEERNSEVENVSLRVDGTNDTSSILVPKHKNTGKQKYATFPLYAAKSRNLAPKIPELQLPKPSLVSMRRLTGFSSDESSNDGSIADQCRKSSSRF